MVNYYKYATVFLLVWRLIDFCFLILFDDVYLANSQKRNKNKNSDSIREDPINKVRQEIVELEEKIERVNLVLKNLE
jgi:hypothetical protein